MTGAATEARPPEDWRRLGAEWPNASASRFVRSGSLTWHVQETGDPALPGCLLLHGTGASTHSFRDLMPLLAAHFRTIAIDLPGHGFTQGARGEALSLPGMARAVAMLLREIGFVPDVVAGHSAGAAIAIRMALDGMIRPSVILGFNSALEPIEGNAIFSPLAKALFLNPLTARAVALQARWTPLPRSLLGQTGSVIDPAGMRQYETLFAMPAHVAGALGMMANWDLRPLQEKLGRLDVPLVLVTAEDDRMVPPRVSRFAASLVPRSRLVRHVSGGHLWHEMHPDAAARLIREALSGVQQEKAGNGKAA